MASSRPAGKRGRAETQDELKAKRNEDTVSLTKERSEEATVQRAMQTQHAPPTVPAYIVLQAVIFRIRGCVDLTKPVILTMLSDYKHVWVFTGSGTLAGYVSHTAAQHTREGAVACTDIVGKLRLFPQGSTDTQRTIEEFEEMLKVYDTTNPEEGGVLFGIFLAIDSNEYRYYKRAFVPSTFDLSNTSPQMQSFFAAHTDSMRLRGMPIVQARTFASNVNSDTASAFKLAGFVHSARRVSRAAGAQAGTPSTYLELVCMLYFDLPDAPIATLETFKDNTWSVDADGPFEPPALRLAYYLCLHNKDPLQRIVM